jgi:DNA-binding protein HU-beta
MAGNGISTVMMKGIFEDLAEGHQLPKRLGQELLSSMVERVTLHLRQGDRIRIGGLGTLEVRKREARTGRNPATGDHADRCQQKVPPWPRSPKPSGPASASTHQLARRAAARIVAEGARTYGVQLIVVRRLPILGYSPTAKLFGLHSDSSRRYDSGANCG